MVTEYRPTHKHRPPQTGPITIHCAAKLSAQCKIVTAPVRRLFVFVFLASLRRRRRRLIRAVEVGF